MQVSEHEFDESGDFDLPPELRQVATRLELEATELAKRFPADHTRLKKLVTVANSPSPNRQTRIASVVTSILAICASMLIVVGIWSLASQNKTLVENNRHAPFPDSDESPSVSIAVAQDDDLTELTTPTSYVPNLSGPEMEGWLDLREIESDTETSVSL